MAGPSKARQPIKLSDQPSYSEVRIAYSIVSQPSPEPDEATVPEPVVIKPLTQRFSIPKPSANPPIDTSSNISSKYQDSLATNVDLRRSANFTPSPLLDSFESNFDFGQEVSWTDGEVKYPELPVDPLADGAMAHPTLPSPNLEAVVTAKGKEKERRYSNGQDHTERPASTSVAKSRDTDTKIAATEAEIDKLKKQAIITAKEAEINRIEAKMKSRGLKLVKPGVLDEAHYRSEPNITRRQSHPSLQPPQTHTPPLTLNLDRVSRTAPEQAQLNTDHGIDISQMREFEQQMMEKARRENSTFQTGTDSKGFEAATTGEHESLAEAKI